MIEQIRDLIEFRDHTIFSSHHFSGQNATYHRAQAGEPGGDHLDISRQNRQSCDSFNE